MTLLVVAGAVVWVIVLLYTICLLRAAALNDRSIARALEEVRDLRTPYNDRR